MIRVREVEIPACAEHGGLSSVRVSLAWVCPVCGGPRGEVYRTVSFDGSRRLACDGWTNPCGHVDRYEAVREEAARAAAAGDPLALSVADRVRRVHQAFRQDPNLSIAHAQLAGLVLELAEQNELLQKRLEAQAATCPGSGW